MSVFTNWINVTYKILQNSDISANGFTEKHQKTDFTENRFFDTEVILKQLYFFLFTILLLIQFIPSWEKAEIKEHKNSIVVLDTV